MRVTILGGGSWGTALGHVLSGKGMDAALLVRDAALARSVNERHENPRYLPGLALHPGLRALTYAREALDGAEM